MLFSQTATSRCGAGTGREFKNISRFYPFTYKYAGVNSFFLSVMKQKAEDKPLKVFAEFALPE